MKSNFLLVRLFGRMLQSPYVSKVNETPNKPESSTSNALMNKITSTSYVQYNNSLCVSRSVDPCLFILEYDMMNFHSSGARGVTYSYSSRAGVGVARGARSISRHFPLS